MGRRSGGDETWFRLREWTRGQKEAERLAAHLLNIEGYSAIDPSHPLGGPDGLKDVVCSFMSKRWIGAAYFPNGQKSFSEIKDKFEHDVQGVAANNADGIVFVTNQEISLAQRDEVKKIGGEVDLFHLERIGHLLDTPVCYGIRLEFLDIEMTKEEQLAFLAARDKAIEHLRLTLDEFIKSQTDKSEDRSHEPIYVTPSYDLFSTGFLPTTTSALGYDRVHQCSYCRFGYIINNTGSVTGLTMLPYQGNRSITCPKCGNVERF